MKSVVNLSIEGACSLKKRAEVANTATLAELQGAISQKSGNGLNLGELQGAISQF
jgi:hypothetical protein